MSDGAICGGYDAHGRSVMFCPVEKRRRRFYATFAHWYGWSLTCLGCGDHWEDGELMPRPFARGWRAESIARAKQGWKNSTQPARVAVRAAMDEYIENEKETTWTS